MSLLAKNSSISKSKENSTYVSEELYGSGALFQDGLRWYNEKFLSSHTEKVTFIIIFATWGLIILMSIIEIFSMFPISRRESFVIKNNNAYDDVIKITKMPNYYLNIDENVIRYLTEEYIKNRESYSFNGLEFTKFQQKLDYIKNTSSPKVFEEFQSYLTQENEDNPIANFTAGSTRIFTTISFQYVEQKISGLFSKLGNLLIEKKLPSEAVVYFTTTTTHRNVSIEKQWRVSIAFLYDPIDVKKISSSSKEKSFKKNLSDQIVFFITKYDLQKV